MKKGLLASIICFTSLVFSSCGSKTVKIKLSGDEYIGWEKTNDVISINKNYYVKAYSKVRGYTLYPENIEVTIGGNIAFEGEKYAYTFDENTLTLKINEKAIIANIEVKGTGDLKDSVFKVEVDSESYISPSSSISELINIEHPDIELTIKPSQGKNLTESKLIIEPSNVLHTYTINSNIGTLTINKSELYQDITVKLLKL